MKKLLPVILAVLGLCGGLGAGLAFRSDEAPGGGAGDAAHAAEAATPSEGGHAEADKKPEASTGHGAPSDHGDGLTEFVKLNNQFVVPVVVHGRVSALVIMALSIEVRTGGSEQVYTREPKLRDALLQVMFDHANAGGFDGVFTDGANLVLLRSALKEAATRVMGDMVADVLISDISRQDA